MVDFQSRDTRRGPTIDDESESESESSADAADSSAGDGAAGAGEGTEQDADAEQTATTDPLAESPADAETEDDDAEERATTDPLAEGTADAETADVEPPAGAATTDVESPADAETVDDGLADNDRHTAAEAPADAETVDDSMAEESSPAATAEPATTETGADPLADPTERTGNATGQAEAETAVAAAESGQSSGETGMPTRSVDVAVVTVAGDRDALEDAVASAFETAGHAVVRRERLRGGYDGIKQMVETLVGQTAVDVVVTVGGVGLGDDELAIEAVHPLLEKALPGFGEAFRSHLAEHIGTGIVGVRSAAGLSNGTLVFCLPGDTDGAALAVREILSTEAPILLDQLDD